jgi:endoglucanase
VTRHDTATARTSPPPRARLVALAIVAACLALLPGPSSDPAGAAPTTHRLDIEAVWPTASEATAALGQGMQIITPATNYPVVGEQIDAAEGAAIAVSGGFDSVRFAVPFGRAAGPPPNFTIDPAYLAAVDADVDAFLDAGLVVVLESVGAVGSEAEFLATWSQVAAHFADRPPTVYFELANEPLWEVDDPFIPDFSTENILDADDWNPLVAAALPVVRAANPRRIVVVTAPDLAHPQSVPLLELPADDHLVVTFHQYQPLEMTHQGAGWLPGADEWIGTTWSGTDGEMDALRATMEPAVCWARQSDTPLWMSEFGTFHLADLDSRVAWTSAARRLAEAEGIAWTYFELSSGGFGVWDRVTGAWRQPLLEALMTDGPPLEPWATCDEDSFPAPPPGTCAPAGPLSANGLPLITDPALQELEAEPTPIQLDIDVDAPTRVAPGTTIDYEAQIGFDLQALVDDILDRRVRPFIEETYGPALADTAWVTMHLSDNVSTLPAPDGTVARSADVLDSSTPVGLDVDDTGIELHIDELTADTRTTTAPLTIDLAAAIEPAADTTEVVLTTGTLSFTLELGIGVSFFGSTLEGTLTGPWSCTLRDDPLATTLVDATAPAGGNHDDPTESDPPSPSAAPTATTPTATPVAASPMLTG